MAAAAVPDYLPKQLVSSASPGLRFWMYLSLWEEDSFTVRDGSKRDALVSATRLSDDDRARSRALRARQTHLAMPMIMSGTLLKVEGRAVSPFMTGLGNEHPLENGFTFLNPYGLPYLPGSGVKGVLRAAALELGLEPAVIALLFGTDGDSDEELSRGVLEFWDVLPELKSDGLLVEIMTPHQGHYFGTNNSTGAASPHDSGSPNPIFILTVPPESLFSFHVSFDSVRASETHDFDNLVGGTGNWKKIVVDLFEHAFDWMGFGAKTSVGYGALKRDHDADMALEIKVAESKLKQAKENERQGKTAAELLVADYIEWCTQAMQTLRGRKTRIGQEPYQKAQALVNAASAQSWTAGERGAAADAIEHWGSVLIALDMKDLRKKLKLAGLRVNQ